MKRYNAYLANQILKFHGDTLSDEQCKEIDDCTDPNELANAIVKGGPPFNKHQLSRLRKAAGEFEGHKPDEDTDEWDDDILGKYAQHIINYKYTYNDEAKKVDPNIDTSTEHIGPVAQDIEKVNPAAVFEDEKTGYKKVDTGRVALMNAGAIAELARQVKELKNGG
jgi:hypothetical protein